LTEEGLQNVPRSVLIQSILALAEEKRELRKRIEQLEARLNKDFSNSDRLPCSHPLWKYIANRSAVSFPMQGFTNKRSIQSLQSQSKMASLF